MKKINLKFSQIIRYLAMILIVVIGDQITKILVTSSLRLSTSYHIIDNFFAFTYVQNKGAAWGLLEGQIALFLGVAVIAAVVITRYFLFTKKDEELTRFGLVLVFAGMIGNVIDRVYLGYVRDFLDFNLFGYDFPVFNIADCAVVIGVGLIILEMFLDEVKNVRD